MNIVLVLMIRNESKIIERCLKSVQGIVDAICVHDTGSTDNTCAIVKEFLVGRTGCLTTSEWQNFGHNRTLSFQHARVYITHTLKWKLDETYGLLLDADMIFHAGELRKQKLTEKGYTFIQVNGHLEYTNCRLIRMDHDWICRGVTHEYWDGPTVHLPKEICWIDDKNDGGCKADKFERDARLLEEGLAKEPGNVRYMFYLAQTYHCLNRHRDAIRLYKQRFHAGGWDEERWYSLYMIGESYLSLKDISRFEKYMNLAYEFRPSRAEALYKLTKYFREYSQHYKAYQYMLNGIGIPPSKDALFVEKNVYESLFYYERSILDYYVKPDRKEGARSSVQYLLRSGDNCQNVLYNLHFYMVPVSTNIQKLTTPQPFGPTFHSSAISVLEYPYANIRYVNYWIEGGEYKTPNNEHVQTQNAYVNLETMDVVHMMDESSISLPKREHHIVGLEDVRVCGDEFTATVHNYASNVRVMRGTYNKTLGTYAACKVYPSPFEKDCEKNWLLMEGTSAMIYDWSPLRVMDNAGNIVATHATPPYFSLLRGSAPGKIYKNEMWVLTHFVEYSAPRKYFHCFVKLDTTTYKPLAVSLPFVFKSPAIEYCVSFTISSHGLIRFYVSFNDSDSSVVSCLDTTIEFFSI